MAKKVCEHLNVETRDVNGVPTAICKDCMKAVDPMAFDEKPNVTPETMDSYARVAEYRVESLVDLPDVGKFYPAFKAQKGDLVIVLRKKEEKKA